MTLPRRPLGNTGLHVSVLGFGASPLGGVFEDISEDVGIQAVHDAFQAGINFFDTSPFYGATKSEIVLGKGLKALPREQVIVATKVGRYGQETFDFSAERITSSVHESLARLQLTYIDLIQVHDMEFGNLDQVVNETLPALQALKAQGLVRHVGITCYPLNVLKYVLDRAAAGSVDVVLSYCHHSLNDMTLLDSIPYLKDKGVGIISASPLSMGLLTVAGPPEWHPASPEIKACCKRAAEHARARGSDLPKIALSVAVRNTDIATTLVGMASPSIVASNVATVLQALDVVHNPTAALEAEVLREVNEILRDALRQPTWPSGINNL